MKLFHSHPSTGCVPVLLAALLLVVHPPLRAESPAQVGVSFQRTKAVANCPAVFLTQDVNGLNGPYPFNLWALQGCCVQSQVKMTLTYSFALFGIDPGTGVNPGPNFVLEKAVVTKGSPGYTDLSITLHRVGQAVADELLVSITAQASIVFPVVGSGTLEWTEFIVDGGDDLSGQIPSVTITRSDTPSQPVLGLPESITTSSIQANWFPNPGCEEVIAYTVLVTGPTAEVASLTLPATETTVMLSGLAPGRAYTLGLTATNAGGVSGMATLQFTSRYPEAGSQRNLLLEQLGQEWNPAGVMDGSLQSVVPSPADMNLDGLVNARDVLDILRIHLDRQKAAFSVD